MDLNFEKIFIFVLYLKYWEFEVYLFLLIINLVLSL